MPLDISTGLMKPSEVILPLFQVNDAGLITEFLGTGFFVGEESLFVTAHHNVDIKTGSLAVVQIEDRSRHYTASVLHEDPKTDVAILQVEEYRPIKRLALGTEKDLIMNLPVVSFEYGPTAKRQGKIHISSANRVGNITRTLARFEYLGKTFENALEVSYPALRGASGAPVLENVNFLVVGMLVGNISYHLMPAQIETIADDEGKIVKDTKFMLPQAIAVNAEAIRAAIEATKAARA